MTRTPHFDVVVVGAGMAGLALAAKLSGEGLKILIVEAAHERKFAELGRGLADWDRRVSALTPASQALLTEIGAWSSDITSRAGRYRAMKVWDANGTGVIAFDAAEVGVSALGHIVENSVTLENLQNVVDRARDIEIRWETSVTGFQVVGDGVEVTLDNADMVTAELLVGADGARSKVRDMGEFPVRGWSYRQHALVATIRLAEGHRDTCYQAFLPSGPLALLPLGEPDLCSIVWSIDEDKAEDIAELSDAAFVSQMNLALAGAGLRVLEAGARARFPLHQNHAMDYCKPRVALIADAAHSIHPLAGQGINLGFSDVAVLAAEVVRAQRDGLEIGSIEVLRRYQRQRKTENLAMMAAMEAFKFAFGSAEPLIRVARNWGLGFVDSALPVKRWLMKQALGEHRV